MRIIAGTARSLPLKAPNGMDTRPTTDKIKETLFNMLQAEVPGAYVLDLFAGSGQIGLEALSRGARYAVFVESSRKAAGCIEENIAFTKFGDRCRLLQMEASAALHSLEGKYSFDIIYMDPPYRQGLEEQVFSMLRHSSLLKEEGVVIAETARETELDFLEDYGFRLLRHKVYKTNAHTFAVREDAD